MFSVALIGADGAGKSTIARMLKESFPLPMKYLYMGINTKSSNVVLPTSRFVRYVRLKFRKPSQQIKNRNTPRPIKREVKHKRAKRLRACVRVFFYLTEEYYRLFVAWVYLMRGYIVLFDRHFMFDYDATIANEDLNQTYADRFHRWLLNHLYSRPNLVIFLDAPPGVLFARKGEGTLSYLEGRRKSFLEQGKHTPNFVTIDATEPIKKVFDRVSENVLRFYESRTGKSLDTGLKN